MAVVGLGVMGSAAAAALVHRGARVLGLDRHRPPHSRGSSHGETRMIRQAYYEDPVYVPLIRRAWRGWESLEREGGQPLLRRTGGLMLGPEDGELLRGVRASAEAHGLPVEPMTGSELERRSPLFRLPKGHAAIRESEAGFLHAERCVEAFHRSARAKGASLRFDEDVTTWEATDGGVEVVTSRRTYRARRLVLAAGPWLPELADALSPSLEVERQVQLWFAPEPGHAESFRPDRFPVFLWEHEPGRFWYGFPTVEEGVKAARHHGGAVCTADTAERTVSEADVEAVRRLLGAGLPGACGRFLRGEVCLYTNMPDGHFLLDHHPGSDRVVLMSPCSGHGFKFAPVLGEMAADLALDGGSGLRPPAFALSGRR